MTTDLKLDPGERLLWSEGRTLLREGFIAIPDAVRVEHLVRTTVEKQFRSSGLTR
jgi:hypothetical protein